MMATTHAHPRPALDRLVHGVALLVLVCIVIAAPLLAMLGIGAGLPPLLPLLTALVLLLFAPFVLMLTTATPPVTVSAEGLTLTPRLWPAQTVAWADVRAVKPYPLLPGADAEVGRRALVGRARYRPAEGIMLVIPGLPGYYRITGFLAGAGFTPVIALTNRTHTDYDTLVAAVRRYAGD
jgi:hypothetical protein